MEPESSLPYPQAPATCPYPPIWRVAANILNKQPRTADKRWSSSFGGGELVDVLTTPYRKNVSCYEMFYTIFTKVSIHDEQFYSAEIFFYATKFLIM